MKQALESCSAALTLKSDYAPALLARGRVLLALHRPADAVVELQRAAELNPLPEYQWALADALALTGDRDRAKEVESQIIERGATEDPRAFSLFLATRSENIEQAVQIGPTGINQPGRCLHARCTGVGPRCSRTHHRGTTTLEQALSEGTVDARLFLHAGIIAALNNDITQAKRWLQKASLIQQMLLPSERKHLKTWQQKVALAATVGAALRGRPFHEQCVFRSTGGHGVPPLQLPTRPKSTCKQGVNPNMSTQFTRLKQVVATLMLTLIAVAAPANVLASSHMDAPLITLDPAANTTDVYAFVDQDGGQKSLVLALGVYPHQEPGIGPNKYNFDDNVLYEIHVALGPDVAAGRATLSYQFRFTTNFKNRNTILQSYLGVVQHVGDANQNLTQTYTVTKVDHRT